MSQEGKEAFRISSPLLNERGMSVVRECPTGMILRETPYVYRAIEAQGHIENGAISPYVLSHWGRETASIVSSERARLREIERENQETKRGSAVSMRTLKAV